MRFLSHTSKEAFERQMLDRAEGEVNGMHTGTQNRGKFEIQD